MDKYIAVLGSGGTGSNIGADFIREGYNVVLIDQWPAHVEAMKANGLHVSMPGPGNDHDNPVEFHVSTQALHLGEVCLLKRQFDTIFLACKSYDSHWMVEFIKPYMKPDGVLVIMQNGLNDEWIAPMVGYDRDIACAFELSSVVLEPGVVKRNTDRITSVFVIGKLDGKVTPQVQEVAQALSAVGRTEVTSNIWGYKWTKLVANTATMPLGSITGVWGSDYIQKYLGLAIKPGRETMEVSKASGIVLEPLLGVTAEELISPTDEVVKRMVLNLASDLGKNVRNAFMQDISKGRPTEADYLNGAVVRKGREVNVPTPLNEAATSLVKQIEQGTLRQSISNLDMFDRYL